MDNMLVPPHFRPIKCFPSGYIPRQELSWRPGLSHTRSNPPTTSELQNDTTRQSNLKPLIEAIEARETAERIRQGYLPDPSLNNEGVKPIAGPSTNTAQLNTRPSFTVPDKRPIEQTGQPASSPTQSGQSESKREGLVSESVPAPGATVDPGKNDDPAELRRLAEEDTKRRIEQRGGEADLRVGNGNVEGVDVGGGGGLAPRRRGKK